MKLRLLVLSLAVSLSFSLSLALVASAQEAATFFQFPTLNYLPVIAQTFGELKPDRIDKATGKPKHHAGDDIDGNSGATKVFSVANGKVIFARPRLTCDDNWGHVIVIEHTLPDGNIVNSIYGHLDPTSIRVSEGNDVKIGQELGFVGRWISAKFPGEPCWGDHLHFGIHREKFTIAGDGYPIELAGYLTQEEFPESYCDPATYILEGKCTTRPAAGTVEIKRVGRDEDGNLEDPLVSIPTTAATDSGVEKADNPAFFHRVLVSNNPHTVGATDRPEYREAVASCNTPGCTLIPGDPTVTYIPADCDGIFCSLNVNVLDGRLTRVVFLYDVCAPGFIKSGVACVPTVPEPEIVLQPGPGEGKDIWTTSVFSYAPGGGGPGGGRDDYELVVGGFGDFYYSLLQFNLSSMPSQASSATLQLFCFPHRGMGTTAMYLDRITQFWDWRTQGTGADRLRLWWADRPSAIQWIPGTLPACIVNQWYTIDITNLYNAWQNGTYPNYGLQLRPVSTNDQWNEFYSSDYLDNPSLRPRLVVTPAP